MPAVLCSTLVALSRRIVTVALVCFAAGHVIAQPGEGIPGRPEAQARLERELAGWRAALPAERPRTFFTAEEWRSLPRRWDEGDAQHRAWRDAVWRRAQSIKAEAPSPYRTPQEQLDLGLARSLRNAHQELWQRPVGDRMVVLSLALALQDDRELRESLRAHVLTACSYPTWGQPISEGVRFPNGDLAAAHVGRGIAIAYDWHPGLWSEAEKQLIRNTVQTHYRDLREAAEGALWWSDNYQDNHNHVNMAALGICGLVFLDEIPDAADWLAHAANNFDRVGREANADGSSPEGVPYWSYSVSFLLQYIEATRRVLDSESLYESPFFRATARYRIASAVPGLDGALPWGDAPQRDYYGPHHLLFRLAAERRDAGAQYLGENLPFKPRGPGGVGDDEGNDVLVWAALWHDPSLSASPPVEFDYYLPVGDLVTLRSGWTKRDYLLAIKSGFTNRSHSHLDAGALAFSIGDEWLLRTPGYGLGQAQPGFFESNGPRWNFLSNRTESHTTLLVDGQNQRFDRAARGTITRFASLAGWSWTEVDLREAYVGLNEIRRQVLQRRGDYILVLDRVQDDEAHRVEWLAQVPPGTPLTEHGLHAQGKNGSLQILVIAPQADFTPRTPDAPERDVSPERLQTWTVASEGTSVDFAVLLVPVLESDRTDQCENATLTTEMGTRVARVKSEAWTDTFMLADEAQNLVATSVRARAVGLGVRETGSETTSVLALGAVHAGVSDFQLRWARPVDVVLESRSAEVWEIYGRELPQLEAGAGWTIEPWPEEAVSPGAPDWVIYRGARSVMFSVLRGGER